MDRLRRALRARLGVDARALAALRIALALLLLADLALRARNLSAFYTDAGVLPRETLRALYPTISTISLHALGGSFAFEAGLFVLAAAFACALAAGYHTRLAVVASFVLLVSLHARNPLVLNGGDSLLRRLLFWSLFLPLGARWSLDSLARGGEESGGAARGSGVAARTERALPPVGRVTSVATAGLLVQVVLVYAVNAVFKHQGALWPAGEAVRYVFSLREFVVLAGPLFVGHPLVLTAADYAWLALVACSPLLLVLTGRARAALAGLFAAAHLGMLATMRLGLFPLVAVTALLAFVPPFVWDRVAAATAGVRERAVRAGTRANARLPRASLPAPSALRRAASVAVPVLLVACLLGMGVWNAMSLGVVAAPDGSVNPQRYGWSMFAPDPPHVDNWYVLPATTTGGERVDALTGDAVSWEPPDSLAAVYPSARWRKYLENVQRSGSDRLARDFAGYECARWNATHETRLARIRVSVVAQETRLAGPEPIRNRTLWAGTCTRGDA